MKHEAKTPEGYRARFVTPAQLSALIELWHLSRTALAGRRPTSHDRRRWAVNAFVHENPSVSDIAAYKDLDSALTVG